MGMKSSWKGLLKQVVTEEGAVDGYVNITLCIYITV